ncbi:hypothetical protein PtB15_1B117 [Puccinia triticina]|nr:hypothetical protein PtB15_1B117 [Puccinia triticina]
MKGIELALSLFTVLGQSGAKESYECKSLADREHSRLVSDPLWKFSKRTSHKCDRSSRSPAEAAPAGYDRFFTTQLNRGPRISKTLSGTANQEPS